LHLRVERFKPLDGVKIIRWWRDIDVALVVATTAVATLAVATIAAATLAVATVIVAIAVIAVARISKSRGQRPTILSR